jgi:uncharacterized protein (DUF2141 family)
MKTPVILLFSLLIWCGAAQSQSCAALTVHIENFESDAGRAFVALYDSKKNWLKKRCNGEIVAIQDQKATVVFEDVPPGTYAVSLYQDENGNGTLDTNFFGIPKEPTACSNNATGRFGPPSWSDAYFDVEDAPLEIKIQF